MYAEFDDSLITGNQMIDSQHKVLIEKINDLAASCEQKRDKLNAVRMLNYLADYTEFHFQEEEKLQEEIGYPGLAEHRAKHQELRQTVEELRQMLEEEEGPSDAFVDRLNQKVIEWLYYHIKGFDRSVAEYRFMRENTERL